jgi:hypothetical protein
LAGTETLTNKTINSASNTITITESNISDLQSYILADSTDTLTNKSISLTSNTLSGTTAEFNSALSDGSFTTLAGTETLTNKTIDTANNTITIVEADISDLGSYITASSTDTLTNKTINGSQLVDGTVANAKLTNSSITVTDGTTSTATSLGGTITFSGTANEIEVGESSGTLTFGLPDDVTIGNNLTISGNLTVSGTTTTVNTETINLADNTITLNSNETGTPSQDGGIEIERGTSANKTLIWNETTDKWTVGSETFVAGTFEGDLTGNVTGNVTGDVTGDVTGNADTATTLETARSIAGQSFDGSADITIASTDLSDTSSITLNSATQTLTNKTINSASNTITITESNISDLGSYITASSTDTLTNKSGNISQWTNDSGYLTSFTETNDLTAAVTWANVPDANITQSSVTQHQAALSITESQISDLGSYITASSTDTLTNKTISGSSNTISGINATSIADGSISNTEFQHLNGVSSNIQTQLDAKATNAFAIAQAVALG